MPGCNRMVMRAGLALALLANVLFASKPKAAERPGEVQNFPGEQGVADLREFAEYLNQRTEIPIAITSNHGWPDPEGAQGFEQIYANSKADIATWHFSRDRHVDGGWKPVYDCWQNAI